MKKLFWALSTLVAIFTLSGCQNDECKRIPSSHFGPNPGGEDCYTDDYDY